jgi:hypothetical protein
MNGAPFERPIERLKLSKMNKMNEAINFIIYFKIWILKYILYIEILKYILYIEILIFIIN